MMKVCYSELDGPEGLSCRLEAAGHAGFAPPGQDIVCAGASTLMQALEQLQAQMAVLLQTQDRPAAEPGTPSDPSTDTALHALTGSLPVAAAARAMNV